MQKRSDYVDHVIETMREFGRVEAKSMFGGWGLYRDGLFFALVAEDTLYLKVDEGNRAAFEAEGEGPFIYEPKEGSRTAMSYHRPPAEALENPPVMAKWARLGYAAALRAAVKKKKVKKK